ncbi:MAG: mannose-6-phosphate isomerase-like protein (cupin superfamily) [Candidatus Azotimanducaceae bacterium]|jgi:mannose-6-phosphate isomerase-like protein (cupin superfamily)
MALLCFPHAAASDELKADARPTIPGPFLDAADIPWKVNEFDASRWKTLVGGIEGGQIDQSDIQFGVWELAPLAIYHSHRHEVPEIYFITEGRALWTVGDETREVTAGMTIYSKPGAIHKMVNPTDQLVKAIWVWWAPGGDTSAFAGEYEFTEPAPKQPKGAGFKPGANKRVY